MPEALPHLHLPLQPSTQALTAGLTPGAIQRDSPCSLSSQASMLTTHSHS